MDVNEPIVEETTEKNPYGIEPESYAELEENHPKLYKNTNSGTSTVPTGNPFDGGGSISNPHVEYVKNGADITAIVRNVGTTLEPYYPVYEEEDLDIFEPFVLPIAKKVDLKDSKMTKLPNGFLANSDVLTDVVFPNGITEIGDYCFANCHTLPLTELPNTITHIGVGAFQFCNALALEALPNGLTAISPSAFFSTAIRLTELPAGITSIGGYAFCTCANVALASLPAGLNEVGSNAFKSCPLNIENLEVTWSALKGLTFANVASIKKVWIRNTCTSVKATSNDVSTYERQDYAPFWGCSSDLVIYVEASEKPSGFSQYFARIASNTNAQIVYGQTTSPF